MKFIFDENLGPNLADGLNKFGKDVEHITVHCPPGTADEVLLKLLGDNGWFLVTLDKGIRRKPTEKGALKKYNVGAFFLQGKNVSGWGRVKQIVRAWENVEEKARSKRPPFAYLVRAAGKSLEKLPLD